MNKLSSLAERDAFLEGHIKNDGSYFVVKHGGQTELIWFNQFKKWNADGSDWYLEYPCTMRRLLLTATHDKDEYEEMGYVLKEGGYAYEVDSPQVSPFLPEVVEMMHLGDSEERAVDWMLANTYANHEWRDS